jgi:phage terminase small subunit
MKGRGSSMRERFPIEYLKDWNATQAAIRAGYSRKTAGSQGERLLKSAGVRKAIDEAAAKLLNKTDVTVKRVMEELDAIAYLDPKECVDDNNHSLPINEISENARRAIASFTIEVLRDCDCHRCNRTHVRANPPQILQQAGGA